MKLLTSPLYNVRDFTWTRELGSWLGCVEASDLGLRAGMAPHGNVYDDAVDEGFRVENITSGKMVIFTLSSEDKSEGDVLCWNYVSEDGKISIRIYND